MEPDEVDDDDDEEEDQSPGGEEGGEGIVAVLTLALQATTKIPI